MPTLKDIAKEAGVSYGTVSNVVNKNGKVSSNKIKLVEVAMKKLDYKINAPAKQLRQGYSKKVAIILPNLEIEQYQTLYTHISNKLFNYDYEVNLYTVANVKHIEEATLEKVLTNRPNLIICINSIMQNEQIIKSKIKTIFVDCPIKAVAHNCFSVSFDFALAGKEIAQKIIALNYKNVALFADSNKSNCSIFSNALKVGLENNNIAFKEFFCDHKLVLNSAIELLTQNETFDAIVSTSLERCEALKVANNYCKNSAELPKLISLSCKKILTNNEILRYELDYSLLGEEIADYIIKKSGNFDLNIKNNGFRFEFSNIQPIQEVSDKTIHLLALSSPTMDALSKLLPHCKKTTGINVKITALSFDEIYDLTKSVTSSMPYDLIRLDMAWLSELAPILFKEIDLTSATLSELTSHFCSEIYQDYYYTNKKAYTLPFDPSVQLLYYRKDLFEDAKIKRLFFEMYKRELTLPQNFIEYNEIAHFFTKSFNPNSPILYGSTLTFGVAAVASCDFLPRYKDFGGKILNNQQKINLNTTEAKKALENYKETFKYTNKATNLWWNNSIELFASGEVAMTTVFANHASHIINDKNSNVIGKVGFTSVPGNTPLLGGGVIGIGKSSTKDELCLEFLKWVYSNEIAEALTLLGGLSPCSCIYNNPEIANIYPWIPKMQENFSLATRRNKYKNGVSFDDKKFENILGIAVRNVVTSISSIDDALSFAQHICENTF